MLVLATIAIYWPSTRFGFVNLDDNVNVTSDVHVLNGLTWESIKWALLNPMADNWQPLTAWSHMLVCQVCGLNPWGHHLANVLLHALNAGLVFALLQRMTGASWRSLLVAALFAVHPLRVESVAWVTERKDVLSAFFGLLALIAYARYAEYQRLEPESGSQHPVTASSPHASRFTFYDSCLTPHAGAFYLLSLFFLALGLMSKPMLVTWPFVMLLLDYWPLHRFELSTLNPQLPTALRLVREKIPFFVLAALMSVVTFSVQKHAGVLSTGEKLTLGARLGNALISYCRYPGKLFWPADLAVFYPHPGHWPVEKVLLAGGLLLGISVLVWVPRRRYPYLLMGWLWYCGTLAPVSQVIQTGGHAMADRWIYLPCLGVLILAVWGASELTQRWRYQVLALSVASGAALVLCLAVTRRQLGYWKNSDVLLRHALAVTENNWLAHRNLAGDLYSKGQMDEAISHFREFVRLRPEVANSHYNLGVALSSKGRMGEAIGQFQEALRLNPDNAEAHNNLGTALDEKGQLDEAIRQYQEALRLKPDYEVAHINLGVALGKQGQIDEAIRQLQEAIRLKPDHAEARNNLGTAFYQLGRIDKAINEFQEALRLKPDYVDARRNLDVALAAKANPSPPPGATTNH
jgi:Flp pilus assembly protein TadD